MVKYALNAICLCIFGDKIQSCSPANSGERLCLRKAGQQGKQIPLEKRMSMALDQLSQVEGTEEGALEPGATG